MKTSLFDYELPKRFIAQHPAEKRDCSRLLVLHRETGSIEHRIFSDLPEYIRSGDVLVVNDTRVIRARLFGKRSTGGAAEVVRFETERIEKLLAPLDRAADRMIRAEALSVGIATAVSPSGALDAFLVLWRNANLVSRIAGLYYGKPGVRGSLLILGDVLTAQERDEEGLTAYRTAVETL